MSQWDVYNTSLFALYKTPTTFLQANGIEAVCEHLCLDNLAFSNLQEEPWSTKTYKVYAIHPNGIKLVSSLPDEYKDRPYEYFLKLKQDSVDAEANFKELIKQVNVSTIKTSLWTKYMFIGTLAIAIGTIILAIYPFLSKSDEQQQIEKLKIQLQQLQGQLAPPSPPKRPDAVAQYPKTLFDSSKTVLKRK